MQRVDLSTAKEPAAKDLSKRVKGEVLFDAMSRQLYATDASIYQVTPIGVVVPKDKTDVINIMKYCSEHEIPVLPRGAGTSLGGQTVGEAIILDFSKYMNKILEINEEKPYVRVQPGAVYGALNRELMKYGKQFAPDPASGARVTLGGIIGNNSSGAHSVRYGITDYYTDSLEVVLANGEVIMTRELDLNGEEIREIKESNPIEDKIYDTVVGVIKENKDEIERRFPKVQRNVSGYNLNRVIHDGKINLSKLIVGSEGTLGIVTEAKLKLVDLPERKALCALFFDDVIKAGEAVSKALEHDPSAVELVDDMVVNLAKKSTTYRDAVAIVPEKAKATLIIEFDSNSKKGIEKSIKELKEHIIEDLNLAFDAREAYEPEEQQKIWLVRNAAIPLLLSNPGRKKPIPFIEDMAVDARKLPELIRFWKNVEERYDTEVAYFCHAGRGCLHIRPHLDLKKESEIQKMEAIAEEATDVALELGGSLSGEHGNGRARTRLIRKMYGDQICEALKEIKRTFDPKNLLNPGNIVDFNRDMTKNLRYGANYSTIAVNTNLIFDEFEAGFEGAIDMCNGCGYCTGERGYMCPPFRAIRQEVGMPNEIYTTRGRMNLIRAAINGALPVGTLYSKELREKVLDLCIGCKSCAVDCPSGVDMAKIKAEIFAQKEAKHGVRDWILGNLELMSELGSRTAPLSNILLRNGLTRRIADALLGISEQRDFPTFHRRTFRKRFKSYSSKIRNPGGNGRVALFYDFWINYYTPEVGITAVRLLEHNNLEVVIPEQKGSGAALMHRGEIDKARRQAEYNVKNLAKWINKGYAIVAIEPSGLQAVKNEYLELLRGDEVKLFSEHTYDLAEYLVKLHNEGKLNTDFSPLNEKVVYHPHCHQRVLGIGTPWVDLMNLVPKLEVKAIEVGCCGLSGPFGFEKEHFDLSMKIGKFLFDELTNSYHDYQISTAGGSCQMAIEQGTGRKVVHPATIVERAYGLQGNKLTYMKGAWLTTICIPFKIILNLTTRRCM